MSTHQIRNNVTVRTGPGLNYRAIGKMNRGDKVEVIQERRGWSQLSSGNWINSRYALQIRDRPSAEDGAGFEAIEISMGGLCPAPIDQFGHSGLSPTVEWRDNSNYIDKVVRAGFDPLSGRFWVWHRDGSKIFLNLTSILCEINQHSYVTFISYRRDSVTGKIFPPMFNDYFTPNIAWLARETVRLSNRTHQGSRRLLEVALGMTAYITPGSLRRPRLRGPAPTADDLAQSLLREFNHIGRSQGTKAVVSACVRRLAMMRNLSWQKIRDTIIKLVHKGRLGGFNHKEAFVETTEYLIMKSDNALFAYKIMKNNGRIFIGRFNAEIGRYGDYMWTQLP